MGARLDRDFVRWVNKAALVLLLVLVPPAGFYYGTRVVLGYALGGAISIALLWSHQWLVARAFERGVRGVRRAMVGLWLLKYPALVAILYFAVSRRAVNVIALCVGLGLVPLAITLKTLGGALLGRGNSERGR